MGRMNWSRRAEIDLMRRRGTEDVDGEEPEEARPPPRRRKPKAELRAEAEAALAEYRGRITVALECRACGHQGTARLPQDRSGVTVYCSKCGTVLDIS